MSHVAFMKNIMYYDPSAVKIILGGANKSMTPVFKLVNSIVHAIILLINICFAHPWIIILIIVFGVRLIILLVHGNAHQVHAEDNAEDAQNNDEDDRDIWYIISVWFYYEMMDMPCYGYFYFYLHFVFFLLLYSGCPAAEKPPSLYF